MRIPAELVVIENKIILQRCSMYKDHSCAVVNAHHICPKSWFEAAGTTVITPMVNLCPGCHMNVHAAIDGMIKGQDIRAIPPRARHLADEAFRLATLNHLTPGLTL
jgi:hypothetical protein